jgi:hypothetical protein
MSNINNMSCNCFFVNKGTVIDQVNVDIKNNYLNYIKKYGVPSDGIFLPERLIEFTSDNLHIDLQIIKT